MPMPMPMPMPMSMPMSMPLRVSEVVTRKNDEVETSVHFPHPSSHSIPSTLSNTTSTQHSRTSNQSAPNKDSPSSSLNFQSTIPRHRNNSTATITTPIAHALNPSVLDSRNVRRPTSSPSSLTTPSQKFLTPLLSSKTSYFSPQPGTSSIDPRSTPNRRQPASRSSHGIETLSGPPPALSTQRSYTAESTRRQPSPAELTVARPNPRPRSKTELSIDSGARWVNPSTNDNRFIQPSKMTTSTVQGTTRKEGKMAVRDSQFQTALYFDDDQDRTVRNLEDLRSSAEINGSSGQWEEQSKSLHEDLFLNLAKADALTGETEDGTSKSERRRSRIGVLNSQYPHPSLPPSAARPSSSGKHISGHSFSSSQGSATFRSSAQPKYFSSPSFPKNSSPKDRRYAATAHPLERDSQSLLSSNVPFTASGVRSGSNRETSPESPTTYGQKQSLREPSPGLPTRPYKQSNLSYSTNGRYTSSSFIGSPATNVDPRRRPQIHHADDTESIVSTTAPSTIWDNLEDLKHTARKIEQTSKQPSLSGAAISNAYGERPQTASTTMTTISSSPKHGRVDSISLETSTIKGPETAQIHPLLRSALARSKPLIGPDIYNALESTASDALNLAAMTGSVAGSESLQDSIPASGIDRQLRRKADSICRSLTELCIALTTAKSETGSPKAPSPRSRRDRSISLHQSVEGIQEPRYLRAASEDPGIRSNSRVLSRIEARRTSMQMFNPNNTQHGSPQDTIAPAASATPPANRLDRTSPSRRRITNGDNSPNNSARPTSRAVTEITHFRPSPSSRALHEYTSQHPLPSPSQRSPSVQSSLPVRRHHFSPSSEIQPSTPTILPGSRRCLDRATPPSSADNARLAEMKQQRMASLNQSSIGGADGLEKQA